MFYPCHRHTRRGLAFLHERTVDRTVWCRHIAKARGISSRAGTDGGKSPFFSSWQGQMHGERRSVGKSGLYRPAAKTGLASLESWGGVAGCGRRIVVGHYRKIRRIR